MFTPNFCLKCKGTIFALDKSASKINQIQDNSARLGLSNITAFVFDSTAACIMENSKQFQEYDATELVSPLPTSPPFLPNSFDRILLDAPCSALGQRPQLYNPIRMKEVQSFARLKCFVITIFSLSWLIFLVLKIAEKAFSYGENSNFKTDCLELWFNFFSFMDLQRLRTYWNLGAVWFTVHALIT